MHRVKRSNTHAIFCLDMGTVLNMGNRHNGLLKTAFFQLLWRLKTLFIMIVTIVSLVGAVKTLYKYIRHFLLSVLIVFVFMNNVFADFPSGRIWFFSDNYGDPFNAGKSFISVSYPYSYNGPYESYDATVAACWVPYKIMAYVGSNSCWVLFSNYSPPAQFFVPLPLDVFSSGDFLQKDLILPSPDIFSPGCFADSEVPFVLYVYYDYFETSSSVSVSVNHYVVGNDVVFDWVVNDDNLLYVSVYSYNDTLVPRSIFLTFYDQNHNKIDSVPYSDGHYVCMGCAVAYNSITVETSTDRGCDKVTVVNITLSPPSCSIGLQTSSTDVYPKKTGHDSNTTSEITVSLDSPAPPEGCTVNLNVEPVTDSGGHLESNHTGARPTGSITDTKAKGKGAKGKILNSISFAYNGKTIATATYTSSAVAGQEKIKANVNGKVVGEATINVKVPDLSTLESKPNLLLWGGTVQHELNNYGTAYTKKAVYYAVDKYSKYWTLNTAPSIHLAVIDMSLPWGGLFDISGNWKSPHDLHRIGRSTDLSKYYKDGSGNNINVTFYDKNGKVIKTTETIDDDWLDKKFKEKKCQRLEKKIGKIHYECPK